MDVKSVFLNGYLNDKVYVEQLKGFIDFCSSDHVYKLKKVLYDLKQAHITWTERLIEFLTSNYYIRAGIDDTLFVKKFFTSNGYTKNIVKKFGLENVRHKRSHAATHVKLTKDVL